jgi:hypothetical protein
MATSLLQHRSAFSQHLLMSISQMSGIGSAMPSSARSTPPEAEALAARLYATLPRIRVTDLLTEVAHWSRFSDCFTHLRTGEIAADSRVLMAGLLAEGLNLSLTRMAEAANRRARDPLRLPPRQ